MTKELTGTITFCEAPRMEGPWDIEVTVDGGLTLAFRDQKLPLGSRPLSTGHTMKVSIDMEGNRATASCVRDDKASFPTPALAGAKG